MIPDFPHNIRIRLARLIFLLRPDVAQSLPSHCLDLDLNGLFTRRDFWLISGMLGNYTIPKWKEFLKSREPILRKSYLSTFIHINKHIKWIHLVQKKFDFHAWVKKCHYEVKNARSVWSVPFSHSLSKCSQMQPSFPCKPYAFKTPAISKQFSVTKIKIFKLRNSQDFLENKASY